MIPLSAALLLPTSTYMLSKTIQKILTIALLVPLLAQTHPAFAQTQDNPILFWNSVALEAIRVSGTPPPYASRNLAMIHAAVFDAVNGIEQQYTPYHVRVAGPPNASTTVAASAAAREILATIYPDRTKMFETQYAHILENVPKDTEAYTQTETYGRHVATNILEWRHEDGSDNKIPYQTEAGIGLWEPTFPYFLPALLPQWESVDTFVIDDVTTIRPPGPPALNTPQYAAELNEVKALGKKYSDVRTPEQTEIAHFWEDGRGTYTPPGHWNTIAQDLARKYNVSPLNTARLFLILNAAMADAGIASWDAKFHYDLWRPVVAIQNADQDNNPETHLDRTWQPLLETPPFPEYTSGHSTFSGAASAVLSNIFGPDTPFTSQASHFTSVERSFTSFSQAAEEAGMSRIYGGIHFQSANQHGLATGRHIGQYAAENLAQPLSATSPVPVSAATGTTSLSWIVVISAIGALASWRIYTRLYHRATI